MDSAMAKRASVASNLAEKLPEGTHQALRKAVQITVEKGWSNVAWPEGKTGLHLAAQLGDATVIKVLMAANADVSVLEAKDAKGKTPYDYAWERQDRDPALLLLLTRTQAQAPPELYERAREEGAKDEAWTAIFEELRATQTLLVRPDEEEFSLLHYAARFGNRKAAEILVNEFDADAAEVTGDEHHEDAAAVARRHGHEALESFLSESVFAQVHFTDSEGRRIRIKFTQACQLELFVDGKHRVRRMHNVTVEGDTLTFDGQRILFNEDSLTSEELKGKELSSRILDFVKQTRSAAGKVLT